MTLILRDGLPYTVYPDGSETAATPEACGEEIGRLRAALMIARRYIFNSDLEYASVPNGGAIGSWPSLGAVIDKALGVEQYGQESKDG